MIKELRHSVRASADRRQDEVLVYVLEQLEYLDSTTTMFDCSYRIHLPTYAALKINLHRFTAKLNYETDFGGQNRVVDFLIGELRTYTREVSRLRSLLYSNPCYKCSTCLERKKAWPKQYS